MRLERWPTPALAGMPEGTELHHHIERGRIMTWLSTPGFGTTCWSVELLASELRTFEDVISSGLRELRRRHWASLEHEIVLQGGIS